MSAKFKHMLYAAGLFSLALSPVLVQAAPQTQQKTQVPGYYRMMLGQFEVTALYDGSVPLETTTLHGINAKDIQSMLDAMFVDSSKGMQTAVNSYLINTGQNLVLVDSGAGLCFGPGLGAINDNIIAAGYQNSQIDTVLLTHLHGDHACGLIDKDGKALFPNADVYAAKGEADFWLSEEVAAKAPAEAQPFFKMSRDSVAPYVATNHLKTYNNGDTLLPGLKIVPTPGHTPGHTGYLFSSDDQSLLLWGDIVHNYVIQLPRPEVSFEFDVDEKQAIATRKKVLADAAKNRLWIGGAHLPFPGLGHVRAEKTGYSWVPVAYTTTTP